MSPIQYLVYIHEYIFIGARHVTKALYDVKRAIVNKRQQSIASTSIWHSI